MQTKECKVCRAEKPLTAFYDNASLSDGKDKTCSLCRRTINRIKRHTPMGTIRMYFGGINGCIKQEYMTKTERKRIMELAPGMYSDYLYLIVAPN